MNDHEISQVPAHIRDGIAEIGALLGDALVKQWQRQPVHHMDKQGGGAPSQVSNPTADTALDTGRLKLRATVLATARELSAIDARLASLRLRLDEALREYDS